jgi:hypothetical protein
MTHSEQLSMARLDANVSLQYLPFVTCFFSDMNITGLELGGEIYVPGADESGKLTFDR